MRDRQLVDFLNHDSEISEVTIKYSRDGKCRRHLPDRLVLNTIIHRKPFTLMRDIEMTTMTDTDTATVFIEKFVDAKGFDAIVDGPPRWESDNPAVATVTPAEDGMSCVVTAVAPGACGVWVIADPVMGEEVGELKGFETFEITSGQAASVILRTEVAPV
jgi:hypothetical protein